MDSLLVADTQALSAACAEDLSGARAARERFRTLPEGSPFDVVLSAFDGIGHSLNRTSGLAHLFIQVHPDAAVRAAMAQAEQDIERFSSELSLDRGVYQRLARLEPDGAPDPVSRRVLEHALRDFRRAGVDRDEATRVAIAALREELVELGQTFARHIAADARGIEVERSDLEGLPDDFVAGHPPGADGRIRISTDPPDALPFLKYARRRARRAELHVAFQSRAHPQNLPVLARLLAARHELATLLGYPHWAAYVTEDKMIRTAEAAAAFIERVASLSGPRMERELHEMRAALRQDDPAVDQVRDHDRGYAGELVRRARFGFDSRELRPYLSYGSVKAGLLDTAARLYGLRFQRREGAPVWHPDVEAWEVWEGSRKIAHFWLDMHPRPDKFKHAALFHLGSGLAGRVLPGACLVANFPRPAPGEPALLDPGDVRTFFHEFGHLLHHLLAGEHRWLATSGIATEWDFVEVPSQLFEEWARDRGVLQHFARHHQTGEVVPSALVERWRAADEWGKGLSARVQMFYAALSLEAHRSSPAPQIGALVRQTKARMLPMPIEPGTCLEASFGHLDGYSALYYTYMWSLVLAKDCLSAFGDDLMDAAVAARFRRAVLAPGGSRDAADLLADFLGRPYSFDAFQAWLAA